MHNLAYAAGIPIALQNDELKVLSPQGIFECGRSFNPAAMSGVSGVPQRTVNEFDVVLILCQDSNGYALSLVQVVFLGNGTGPDFPGFSKMQMSLYNTAKLVPDAVSKP
jgi:hypothetical protein